MATTSEVYETVVDPMAALCGRPWRRSDEEIVSLKAQYVEALRCFSAETLQAAWADVRKDWTKSGWPPIGMIVAMADKIASKARSSEARRQEREKDDKIIWPIAVQWLWETDNGRFAVERDVCETFCYEAVRLQRIPSRQEVQHMVVEPSTITEEELRKLEGGSPLQRQAAQFGRTIKENSARLREKAVRQMIAMGAA